MGDLSIWYVNVLQHLDRFRTGNADGGMTSSGPLLELSNPGTPHDNAVAEALKEDGLKIRDIEINHHYRLFCKYEITTFEPAASKTTMTKNHQNDIKIRQLGEISFGNLAGFNPRFSPASRWLQGTSARRHG